MVTAIEWNGMEVRLLRRKGTKRMHLKVLPNSQVSATAPYRTPERLVRQFLDQQSDWIFEHMAKIEARATRFQDGDLIGKRHILHITHTATSLRNRVSKDRVVVSLPPSTPADSQEAQRYIAAAADRALRMQAKELIPPRLAELAAVHGLDYKDVRYKKMSTRWGSCSSAGNLNFNIHLMRLPQVLIDLVIQHELAHTVYMSHGSDFWRLLEGMTADVAQNTSRLKEYSPHW